MLSVFGNNLLTGAKYVRIQHLLIAKRVNFVLFTLYMFLCYILPKKRLSDLERQIYLIDFAQCIYQTKFFNFYTGSCKC